jgi:hypothetical protein
MGAKFFAQRSGAVLAVPGADGDGVRQFHHVIEVAVLVIAAHMIEVNQAFMLSGDWFELANAMELTLVRALILKVFPPDDLDRPKSSQGIPGHPDFAIAALPDEAYELVIGNSRFRRYG